MTLSEHSLSLIPLENKTVSPLSSFKEALKIHGVFQVCLAYGCCRSVILGILFWLPYYLESRNYETKVKNKIYFYH